MTEPRVRTFPSTAAGAALEAALAHGLALGDATFDPYDLKALPWVLATYTRPSALGTAARRALAVAEVVSPVGMRRVCRVPKRVSAGGLGRWASACLSAYRLTSQPTWLKEAERALGRLAEKRGEARTGTGWGLPFDWASGFGLVPSNTALSHTTLVCGEAFLEHHRLRGERASLDIARSCALFLREGLRQTELPGGAIALTYSELDASQVVNISSQASRFLPLVDGATDNRLVEALLRFVLGQQQADGSWPYAAPGSPAGSAAVDNYHTAMVLEGLAAHLDRIDARQAYGRGLVFYCERLLDVDGAPKMLPTSRFPIDSYGAGQGLLTLTEALHDQRLDEECRRTVAAGQERLLRYTLAHLACPDGSFVTRRHRLATVRLDSMRWAHSLLCHALSEVCLHS